MSDPSARLSPVLADQLGREADAYLVTRATPGVVMGPALMVSFTAMIGRASPFWPVAITLTLTGLVLMLPRVIAGRRLKTLPAGSAPARARAAFVATTMVSTVVFATYVAVGVATVHADIISSALIFACTALLAGAVNIFAARRTLMSAMVIVLYAVPLSGTLLSDSSGKALLATLVTLQTAYALILGGRLHAEYWELAVARARLGERNRDMRLVLDHVDQAFLTIDHTGRLAMERSATVDHWFGSYGADARFVDFIAATDPAFADAFAVGHEALVDGFLPREVSLAQLPSRIRKREREYRCTYVALPRRDGGDGNLLIVINDVTEALRHANDEVVQKELLAVAQGLVADRTGYLSFVDEGEELIRQVRPDAERDELTRALHTLKGNAAMVGAEALAAHCNAAEEELALTDELSIETLVAVHDRWQGIATAMESILGSRARGALEVLPESLDAVIEQVLSGAPRSAVAQALAVWKLEPAERALERLASYAVPLARRLGKGDLDVSIVSGDLRLDPKAWGSLWSVLVHVVRNAVDHGIEAPEERAASGKAAPRLALHAHADDGFLVVAIQDDGRGIDWARVRTKAAALGLPCTTRADLEAALLDAGFTTRDDATAVSGRGIGMAAVAAEVRKLGGSVSVVSELGSGTMWRVRLPLVAVEDERAVA
jgi:HPt (histidine-containing phosphotransfer) domain-containing protein